MGTTTMTTDAGMKIIDVTVIPRGRDLFYNVGTWRKQ